MKKEISLSKVIETLSAHDAQAKDAQLLSIHGIELEDGMNYIFRVRHADGFVRAIKVPLYEKTEEPVLTKEEAIKRHRMMWNWIAYETLKQERFVTKQEAIEHFGWCESKITNKCWCCTYVCKTCEDGTCEDNCPIRWPGDVCYGDLSRGIFGLYTEWCTMEWPSNYKKAAELAYQIASLSEKESEKSVLTKEEAIKRHRMMWNWIAYETLKQKKRVYKRDAVKHFGWNSRMMSADCWCCTYVRENDKTCESCPMEWPSGTCTGFGGLFDKWTDTTNIDYEKGAELAYQIANLPEREDVE